MRRGQRRAKLRLKMKLHAGKALRGCRLCLDCLRRRATRSSFNTTSSALASLSDPEHFWTAHRDCSVILSRVYPRSIFTLPARLSCFAPRIPCLMSVTREDYLRQLEERVQSCRAAVLRDAPGAVGDSMLRKVMRSTIMRTMLYERLRTANDESRDVRLEKLGDALLDMYNLSGGAATLEEAIAAYEEALQLRPKGHHRRATALDDLGGALRRFCEVVNTDTAQLDRGILLHREALQLRPLGHSNRDASLNNLAISLQTRFEQTGDLKTLDEAITLNDEALQLRPLGHPYRDASLNNLATSLQTRFKQQGGLEALDKAITLNREALQLHSSGHPLRDASLHNLAITLYIRFKREGGLETLDEAVKLNREALQLRPPGHPYRDASLTNLALTLQSRFEQQGGLETLDKAITLNREALRLCAPGHPARSSSLVNLANTLKIRFEQRGELEVLDEAITLNREALQLCAPEHPTRSLSLINLANALRMRFEQHGGLETSDEAIKLSREALQLCLPGHHTRDVLLINLANSLQTRFWQSGGSETLDEAITLNREALHQCPPGHPTRDTILSNLATSLQARFKQQGGSDTLDEAIKLQREALQLCLPGHATRDISLMNLANLLWTRYRQQGDLETQDEVIALHRGALQLRPSGHPHRFRSLFAIARCLLVSRSERFDFTTATAHISEALVDNAGNIQDRLGNAQSSFPTIDRAYAVIIKDTDLITQVEHGNTILQLYSRAIQLLPRAANFGLDANTRLHAIAGSDQLSRDGAAHAIGLDRLQEAVEILEEGRGVFWSQTLHLRAESLDSVPEVNRLQLENIFRVLQSDGGIIGDVNCLVEDRERALAARRVLNVQAEDLITKIRTYPSLDRFLLPPAFDSLIASLPEGFVVILNSSRLGSHALLLSRAAGLVKRLTISFDASDFDLMMARARLPRDIAAAAAMEVDDDDKMRVIMGISRREVKGFENTLQSLWLTVVQPVLIGLGLKV
jgi:tetratricopeptide (TPR) repeat protein